MHKSKFILNAVYDALKAIESNPIINNVVKTNIDTERNLPTVSVNLGSDLREELNTTDYEHTLTFYTDCYSSTDKDSVDDSLLDMRELVENTVYSLGYLGVDWIWRESIFIGQSEPQYNSEGTAYAGMIRLEWQIKYFSQHNTASI